MKIGAERKKVILLAVLSVIAVGTVYTQFFGTETAAPVRRPPVARQAPEPRVVRRPSAAGRRVQTRSQQFRPSFTRPDSEGPLDPMTTDPTLRTDLLAAVRGVEFEGVERNLFQFTDRKKVEPLPSPEELEAAADRLRAAAEPKTQAPKKKSGPRKPRAPKIKWRYYGFANQPGDARKRAFLLDGEEVFVATEGDVFKNRYKIVSIGINSIVIEDMQFKDKQTLPLEES